MVKRYTSWLTTALLLASVAAGCGDKENEQITPKEPEAPKITLEDADAVHEIEPDMSVMVTMTAEAGISSLRLSIDSPALTDEVLSKMALTKKMYLTAPAENAMAGVLAGLGFPVRGSVSGQTDLAFDVAGFTPLIAKLYRQSAKHIFTFTLIDGQGREISQSVKFHTTGPSSIVFNDDADLWCNTASLRLELGYPVADCAVEYKLSTETQWQKASLALESDGSYTASIAPEWVPAADHPAGVKQYTLDGKTGVFAGHSYEYRLVYNQQPVENCSGTFSTGGGQTIPFGDMNTWSKYDGYSAAGKSAAVDYPNSGKDDAFWGNGNNSFTKTLCMPADEGDNRIAALKGGGFSTIFAAGNLYTGKFDMSGIAGYARFGQIYEFSARPIALRVRYKAKITNIQFLGLKEGSGLTTGDLDKARIFVCITDWTSRHSVYSGLGVKPEQINGFDPETDAKTAEGPILGYASKWIDTSTDGWVELTMPILYKSTNAASFPVAKPVAENYSLVISTAASAYGDYLCGSKENELYLDDFEWVY